MNECKLYKINIYHLFYNLLDNNNHTNNIENSYKSYTKYIRQ